VTTHHGHTVKLYAGTTEADAHVHRIAEKRRAEYTAQIGHKPQRGPVLRRAVPQ
jgi:hypothetical protein